MSDRTFVSRIVAVAAGVAGPFVRIARAAAQPEEERPNIFEPDLRNKVNKILAKVVNEIVGGARTV